MLLLRTPNLLAEASLVLVIFGVADIAAAVDREALREKRWEGPNLITTLRQSDPQARRYSLYCRGEFTARSVVNQFLTADTSTGPRATYRVRWDSYRMVKAPNKVDFSKRFYGLEKAECAWEDRPVSQAEPDQLCYVSGLYYASGEKDGQALVGLGFSLGFSLKDNEIWKIAAYRRERPFTCIEIEYWDRERIAF